MKRPFLSHTDDPWRVFRINQRDFKARGLGSGKIGIEVDVHSYVDSGVVLGFDSKPEFACVECE